MIRHLSMSSIRPLLIFFGLFGLGITLPILDLYGQNPEIFIANRSDAAQVLTFVLIIAFAPTIVVGAVWLISRMINPRAGKFVEMLGISVAGFFVASSLLRYMLAASNASLAIAIIAAVVLGYFGRRQGAMRDWLTVLVFVPVVSLISFLGFSDSSGLIWDEDAEAAANVRIKSPAPVVVLVLDELPLMSLLREDGQVNRALFPNFAKMVNSSKWFRNYASNSIATTDSIPIILSGVLNEGAKPKSKDHPNTLFTLLGESYEMHVSESVTSLCPDSICKADQDDETETYRLSQTDGSLQLLLDDARIVYGHLAMPPFIRDQLPAIGGRWGRFLDGDSSSEAPEHRVSGLKLPPIPKGGRPGWINKFIAGIDQFATSKAQSLHYIHLVAPHIPWKLNPSGTVYEIPEQTNTTVLGILDGFWVNAPAIPTQGYQRHLSQLGSLDMLMGYFLDELKYSGLWGRALVIVTADHGISFEPGSHRRWVDGKNANSLYRVPFFMHLPGQQTGEIIDEPAFSIDIMPTIIDFLEIAVDWPLLGISLLGEIPSERTHVYDHFSGKQVSLEMHLDDLWVEISKNYKLIPSTSDWESIAAVGPYREAVGKTIIELGAVTDGAIVASFDGFKTGVKVDKQSGIVPTLLTGRVSIPAGYVTSDLLIAVNGKVQGAGQSIRENGNTFAFSAYVPESALKPGQNRVELLLVSETGKWHHSTAGSVAKTTFRDESGKKFKVIQAGHRLVRMDSVKFENGKLRVRGWTADKKNKILPEKIYIFYGDQIAYSGPPNVERKDVTIWFKADHLIMSGFDFKLPAENVPEDLERVTILASFPENAVLEHVTLQR